MFEQGKSENTVTKRLTIDVRKLCVECGCWNRYPVPLDVTVATDENNRLVHIAIDGLDQWKDDIRARLEVVCRQASALLSSFIWTEQVLIDAWAGTRMDPAGYCRELQIDASGPLDAVAKWLGQRIAARKAMSDIM